MTVIALRCNDRERAADCYRAYAKRLASAGGKAPDAAARSELGGALLEAGLLDEAELELKAALGVDASNADAVVRLARVYLARKDIPAAGRTLEAALARKVEAPAIYALLAVAYENGGSLLKFGGDALMLFFSGQEHPLRACHAASWMRRRLRETAARLWSWEGVARSVVAAATGELDELPRVPS